MRPDRFTFPSASGALLAARLDASGSAPVATALSAHGFTCTKDAFPRAFAHF